MPEEYVVVEVIMKVPKKDEERLLKDIAGIDAEVTSLHITRVTKIELHGKEHYIMETVPAEGEETPIDRFKKILENKKIKTKAKVRE